MVVYTACYDILLGQCDLKTKNLYMGLAFSVLNGHLGPVYLLQVSKNDDDEHCSLK